jgi:hypothetical protein
MAAKRSANEKMKHDMLEQPITSGTVLDNSQFGMN